MARDIVLFYYYSSPSVPDSCFLGISKDIAHRNVFLHQCGDLIHFEFPTFENHSYSSICNGPSLKNLIKRENENDKYILFRTKDCDTNKNHLIGYYKIKRAYYQETSLFDYNGFVWGIEAEPAYLIKKGEIKCDYSGRHCPTSLNDKKWEKKLNKWIDEIEKKENVSKTYQDETKRLISIFKDKQKMKKWKESCAKCNNQKNCTIYRQFKYSSRYNVDMFKVIHNVYSSNIYSKNVLDTVEKKYLRI